jgi:O-succinylbenzoate synthase
LGFGVGPLFADDRFNGPAAAPFLYREDVERLNPEAVWNALS